jgi:2-hydroxy-6-oxonona-2,4-dienedioate hydrolase
MRGLDVTGSPAFVSYPAMAGRLRTRVLECGDGVDNILLLHGAGSRADRWRFNIGPLAAAGFTVRAIDLPGHGFADKSPDLEYTTPAFAAHVISYLEGTGASTIVGTSLGAHVATWVALARPELVKAVVLVGATGLVRRDAASAAVLSDSGLAGTGKKLARLLHDQDLINDHWILEESRVNTSPGSEQALARVLGYLQAGINDDLTGPLFADLDLPTLIVWGAQDQWVPRSVGDAVARLLPTAPYVVMEAAGHAPYFERAADFNDLVLRFLAGHGPPSGGPQWI